jgi:hypothetical protein
MSKRRQRNERDWPHWHDLPENRRRYWIRRAGARWGWQILFKEVLFDPNTRLEQTVKLWQEVYDDEGKLVERHQKFPTDTGHQKL